MGYQKIPSPSEIAAATSPIIVGVEQGVPGNMIQDTEGQQFFNRLASIDGINRTRPGLQNLINTGANPVANIKFFGNGIYLVTDGGKLWSWNTQTQTLTLLFSSMPFTPGASPIRSARANAVMVYNQGAGLFYWDGTNWNTVSMPLQSPNASFPIWASQRLVYAATGTNNVIFGDIDTIPFNFGPANNSTTVTVKLNNDNADPITGMSSYGISAGVIMVGQRSKLWAIFNDPTLAVANFAKQRVSEVIGVAEHETMKQLGQDIVFLSESGNGVFRASSLVGTNNIGISGKLSRAISADIERINWSAVSTARAEVWQDLYILSVPIDGASTPNAMFIYSAALDAWEGIWTGATSFGQPLASSSFSPASMGTNATATAGGGLTAGTELIYGLNNGNIAVQTKPRDAIVQDSAVGGTAVPIQSQILSKAFSPSSIGAHFTEAAGTRFNQIQPYVARLRFPNSKAPVQIDLVSDVGTLLAYRTGVVTNNSQLQLPANLPWNLDSQGSKYQTINLQDVGTCNEMALQISGSGDWKLQSIDMGAYVVQPQDAA